MQAFAGVTRITGALTMTNNEVLVGVDFLRHLVSADRILYQFTVDDPATWTTPWSAEIPMMETEGPLFEYACHEGNYGLDHILSGARSMEKEASGRRAPTPPK